MDSPQNRPPFQDAQTFQIIGAAFEVHRHIGGGFSEPVYSEGLAIEFGQRKVPFAREVRLPIQYKGQPLKAHFRVDFVCFQGVLVESKRSPASDRSNAHRCSTTCARPICNGRCS